MALWICGSGMANSCDIYFYKISGGFDQDGEFVEGLGVDRIARYGDTVWFWPGTGY